jgi:hypothetical protein
MKKIALTLLVCVAAFALAACDPSPKTPKALQNYTPTLMV